MKQTRLRSFVFIAVTAATVFDVATLLYVSRGGGMSADHMLLIVKKLGAAYGPLWAQITVFYLAQLRVTRQTDTIIRNDIAYPSIGIAAVVFALPIFLFVIPSLRFEQIVATLDKFQPIVAIGGTAIGAIYHEVTPP